ncbi:hypothetical protein [Sutcliffiella horikoshii]|uniref:hypothetical protein n=1 Tax=Sutcliffiella horikoshii TaxID=79883 RepID=UPI003CEC7B90
MIQSYLKDEAQKILPELEWSIEFYTGEDNTGTVYSEAGDPPDTYEVGYRYPQYMFMIRSSDWGNASKYVQVLMNHFHNQQSLYVEMDSVPYRIFSIEALGEPLRLGVKDNVMEWTLNVKVLLREVKEK